MKEWLEYWVLVIVGFMTGWVTFWSVRLHDWYLFTASVIVTLFWVAACRGHLRRYP